MPGNGTSSSTRELGNRDRDFPSLSGPNNNAVRKKMVGMTTPVTVLNS
jgi:hypothetical protein